MAHDMVTVVPDSMRQLRACLNCSLIKTTAQFKSGGCENCHPRPQKAGADGRPDPNYRKKELDNDMEQYTLRHTTTEFNGMIAKMDSNGSWVARWQSIERYVRGLYAVSVSQPLGEIEEEEELDEDQDDLQEPADEVDAFVDDS